MTKYLKIITCTACLAFICQTSTVNASDSCVQLAHNTAKLGTATDTALAGASSHMLTALFGCLNTKIGKTDSPQLNFDSSTLSAGQLGFVPGFENIEGNNIKPYNQNTDPEGALYNIQKIPDNEAAEIAKALYNKGPRSIYGP